MQQLTLDMGLSAPRFSLANFLPRANEQALAHLQLWSSNALRSPVPTYLWGADGSGKSHLISAVALAVQTLGQQVLWLDARSTVGNAHDLSTHWDVLLLDDVHLYTAEQQHAAFTCFVHASTHQRWVLAAGALPPVQLQLREDIRSRLGWGHVFALAALNEDDRREALQRQAQERGLYLSPEVMDFVLHHFTRDMSSLMQLLDQLDAYALQTQRAITVPLIKAMLQQS